VDRRHWLVEFFRWDARTVLAACLGLIVLIGFAWAATENSLVASFDFGGVSLADQASGTIQVKGGLSVYPKTSGTLQFGWTSANINEFVDKNVADKIKRDYNSGDNGSVFRISGLDAGVYNFKATVGAPNVVLSTQMRSGTLATSVTTAAGSWQVASLLMNVDNSGTVDLVFASANQTAPWGICGLAIYSAVGTIVQPGFAVTISPTQKIIRAGDTAVFNVGVTPLNNYGSKVSVQITGLVTGMTAEFMPAQLSSPPGTMGLRLYTTKAVPPTDYNLLVTVKGDDEAAMQKNINLKVTVTVAGESVVPNLPMTDTVTGDQTEIVPDLPPRTAKEVRADFQEIESFVAEQKAKALQRNNFVEIKDIGNTLSGVAVYQALPPPKTTTESILQKMVRVGIIGTISDAAPQVQPAPEKPGLWQTIIESIFRPAS